jgi:hypothetical protein
MFEPCLKKGPYPTDQHPAGDRACSVFWLQVPSLDPGRTSLRALIRMLIICNMVKGLRRNMPNKTGIAYLSICQGFYLDSSNKAAIRRHSSSLVFLKADNRSASKPSIAAGSGNPQCRRRASPRKRGHSSSPHRVITVSTSAGGISVTDFERKLEISIPIS